MADLSDCRLTTGTVAGWEALTLENGLIRVVVLPQRGAEILNFVHAPSGVDAMYQSYWGLQPPGAPHREGSGEREFEWNYGGGWQELFPSAHYACTYQGRPMPYHGEVATLPWDVTVVTEGPDELTVQFAVRCRQSPFRLERGMTLKRGEPTVYFEASATNEADNPAHLVWGQHAVVGAPFLEAGCRLEIPGGAFHTPPAILDEAARLLPGQRERWPMARRRTGGRMDLQEVLGPEARSHDVVFVTELRAGRLAVTNPRLNLAFSLHWDPAVYKWVAVWLPYGGPEKMPLTGVYALGIEPWSAPHNLERAIQAGDAIVVAGRGTLRTAFQARFAPPAAA
ncbi:MAG: DUF4432 family protein [Anaerolineales bacterium]|nr:DUF4432 family protein [Anaerolineales bacterium]